MKLLVVEDECDLRTALKTGLTKNGYAVDIAEDGTDALELHYINEYDLIILDLNLPGMDGLDVMREMRKQNSSQKVLILSARSDVDDRIAGLDLGANDYLVKPFHFEELLARIRALLRREFIQSNTILEYGDLYLDTASRQAVEKDIPLILTKTELAILEYLMQNPTKPISAEEFIEHIYDSETDLFSNAIPVHIYSLRKKMKHTHIKTIRGVGYQLHKGASI